MAEGEKPKSWLFVDTSEASYILPPVAPGGRGGIRTHGTVAGTTVFKTVSIDHSDTLPRTLVTEVIIAGEHK
jgi:hypothetical protein